MRCKNCGWPNEAGVARCVKCNAPLQGSMIETPTTPHYDNDEPEQLGATIRESTGGLRQEIVEEKPQQASVCTTCGYPLRPGVSVCPMCKTPVGGPAPERPRYPDNNGNRNPYEPQEPRREEPRREEPRAPRRPQMQGTINPWSTPADDSFCMLRRIPWHNESIKYDPVSYSGQEIELNRANTDQNNNSITSKVQAVLTCEDGEWYIENRSELQTTLLRVDRKMKLEDGDVIVLGNRMFEFKKG